MDLIRTYCEIGFAKAAERWLKAQSIKLTQLPDSPEFVLSRDCFIDTARLNRPDISDDTLDLIYRLGTDEWSRYGLDKENHQEGNIMRIAAFLAKKLLRETDGKPVVQFRNLFRWRELTQLIGEDLFTCALLAYNDKDHSVEHRSFDWPSVAHNDNPDLNFLFRTKKLCELHSHLMASTNIFEISWVSLMNEASHKDLAFLKLGSRHEPSIRKSLGEKMYDVVKTAARLRWDLYNLIVRRVTPLPFEFLSEHLSIEELDSASALERHAQSSKWIPDYIIQSPDSPMSVYAGERYFLYKILKRIYTTNDNLITVALYRYILSKSLFRKFLVQNNDNVGFSNFQRFQDIKMEFMGKGYASLPTSLPLWEARKHNHTQIFESRIVPSESKKAYLRKVMQMNTFTCMKDDFGDPDLRKTLSNKDWMLIFHFIKQKNPNQASPMRDFAVRKKNKAWSNSLADVGSLMKSEGLDRAIDAASSEFGCRPEVFSHTFRFLRHYGFDVTYHAGEDFYDIADGLRAIDEAIDFLQLRSGDRLGHALALGIDAGKYYASRHNVSALPKQWMLDNVVWLLMKSRHSGITIDSRTEWFLIDTYKHLANEIGYSYLTDENLNKTIPDISDYWDSMKLRGDEPDMYEANCAKKDSFSPSPEEWDHYALIDSDQANFIRDTNPRAVRLFLDYHYNIDIRKNGNRVKAFELPPGYHILITELQEMMIKEVAKKQICIECCPSSNVRIGRLDRFENHRIFAFCPVSPSETGYPLAVTVNTDDLGVFSTSLPNEYSLLALALLKKRDRDGKQLYSTQEVYDWIGRLIDNGYKYTFLKLPYAEGLS